MLYKTNEAQRGQADKVGHGVAMGLGVFSIVLGVTELLLGGPLGRALGLQGYEWIVYAYGVREILAGVLIFTFRKNPTPWIWFRVFGDALDLATVAWGYSRYLADNGNFVIAFIALAGATAIDIYCA